MSRSKLNVELRRLETEQVLRLGYRKIFIRSIGELEKVSGGPVFVF